MHRRARRTRTHREQPDSRWQCLHALSLHERQRQLERKQREGRLDAVLQPVCEAVIRTLGAWKVTVAAPAQVQVPP